MDKNCTSCRFAKPLHAVRKQWRCRAADQDVATEQEIEAMEDGAVAIPEDPAGQPITGGHPAPGPQRGDPTGIPLSFFQSFDETLMRGYMHLWYLLKIIYILGSLGCLL